MAATQAPATISIRTFREEDGPEVHRIFSAGMSSLLRLLVTGMVRDASFAAVLMAATGLAAWVASGAGLYAAIKGGFLAASFMVLAVVAYCAHSMQSYIQKSLADDLKDIPAFYLNNPAAPGSCFWVAEATSTDGDSTQGPAATQQRTIVGCVALQYRSPEQAELRRMSVDAKWQRRGIGVELCKALLQHAQAAGFSEVFLTTSEAQPAARALYQRMGWQEVGSGTIFASFKYYKYSYVFGAAGQAATPTANGMDKKTS